MPGRFLVERTSVNRMWTTRLRMAMMLLRWTLAERRAPVAAVSRLAFRCTWADCDFINRHMNNGRYLGFMDLGRYHYILVCGIAAQALRERWAPIVAGVEVTYKKSLRPGDRFVLETRTTHLTASRIRLSQRFLVDGEEVAAAVVTGLFVKRGRRIDNAEVAGAYPHVLEALDEAPAFAPAPREEIPCS